jgi:hypothetical protein
MLKGLIRYETRMGQPYETSGGRITPFSKALIIRLPKAPVGLVWNRPASLLVTREDGQEQVIPVVDITRIVVWSLSGAILAFALIFRSVTRSRRRE